MEVKEISMVNYNKIERMPKLNLTARNSFEYASTIEMINRAHFEKCAPVFIQCKFNRIDHFVKVVAQVVDLKFQCHLEWICS